MAVTNRNYSFPYTCYSQHNIYNVHSHTAKPQWEFMHGLIENAIYGGRVDNTFDMRVLISYLEQCFNDSAITGQAATPTRMANKMLGLPFGNIPVSLRTQVRPHCLYMYIHVHVHVFA